MPSKASLGFYIGGMGAEGANFHKNLMARMGYESEANEIQRLFLEGKRDEAIAMVPSAFADEISLVGPPERIRDRLQTWEDSAVTTLNVAVQDVDTMRRIADVDRAYARPHEGTVLGANLRSGLLGDTRRSVHLRANIDWAAHPKYSCSTGVNLDLFERLDQVEQRSRRLHGHHRAAKSASVPDRSI